MATPPPVSSRNLLLSLLAVAGLCTTAKAAELTWTPAGTGTWSTSVSNWDNAGSSTPWIQGSDAKFNGFASSTNISLTTGETLQVGTLYTNVNNGGTGTIILGSSSQSIDITNVSTGAAAIDLAAVLTGNHDLNYTSSSSTGRLNVKTAMTYTGNTFLTGSAFMLLDGTPNNLLPTGTIVNLGTGTTLRFGRAGNASHEIAGLVSTNTNAGTVTHTTGAGTYAVTLTLNTKAANGTLTFGGNLQNTNNGTTIFDTLNLVVTGTGTQVFNGNNKTYSGTTTVSGGTMILSTNLTGTTAVSVAGGTLQTGTSVSFTAASLSLSDGTLNVGGTGTKGTLNAGNGLTSTGGIFAFDLGTNTDVINGTGSFDLSNSTFSLNLGSGFSYANSYTLFSGYNSGNFSNLSFTGYDDTLYTASLSNSGVLSFAPVPEPGILGFVLAGGALLGFRRRRARA